MQTIERDNNDKINRTLAIYTRLINGYVINKTEEAERYGVNERSIQRDIDDIRTFLDQEISKSGIVNNVIYDRKLRGYRLETLYQLRFSNPELLAICKILLDSRAFTKPEMEGMLEKLIDCCAPKANQILVRDLIKNEEFHYIPPRHGNVFIDRMWQIGQAIQNNQFIEIKYQGIQGSTVKKRRLKPLAIMFSEYYFYLVAFIDDDEIQKQISLINDSMPTIYRIDRIQWLKLLDEHFRIPYADRFEEGEFRKRIQFMFSGKLRRIRFKYCGYSIESVLDRLPTAVIEQEERHEDGKRTIYTITAESYGNGIDMWLKSQGDMVTIL